MGMARTLRHTDVANKALCRGDCAMSSLVIDRRRRRTPPNADWGASEPRSTAGQRSPDKVGMLTWRQGVPPSAPGRIRRRTQSARQPLRERWHAPHAGTMRDTGCCARSTRESCQPRSPTGSLLGAHHSGRAASSQRRNHRLGEALLQRSPRTPAARDRWDESGSQGPLAPISILRYGFTV